MYRIIYNKISGNITLCRMMNDIQLNRYLDTNKNSGSIDGSIAARDITNFWVNPQTLTLEPKPAKQINISVYIRTKRFVALAESDWTQLPDSPISEEMRTAYAQYRQAWRDLPANSTSINNIEDIQWPVKP